LSPAASQSPALVGLDRVTVRHRAGRWELMLHFLPGDSGGPSVPAGVAPANVEITRADGMSLPGLRVRSVRYPDEAREPVLTVEVEAEHLKEEDSLYVLDLVGVPALEPGGSRALFSFRSGDGEPPADLFSLPGTLALEYAGQDGARAPEPVSLSYLVKDFASFRRLMLNEMSLLYPQWEERNPVDLGVAVVEILAYAADSLSYYQDAVATEAYLETARRRVSVRRHARLVDYFLHEGANARAWVEVQVSGPTTLPARTQILTGAEGAGPLAPDSEEYRESLRGGARVFETLYPAHLYPEHNEIQLHDWGAEDFSLARGATSAALEGELTHLRQGSVLVLREVRSPETGDPNDRDPRWCWAVRLSAPPRRSLDRLRGTPITEVSWHPEDALPFRLWISRRVAGRRLRSLSAACANVLLADHGLTVEEKLPVVPDTGTYYPDLSRSGLTFSVPPPEARDMSSVPASAALRQDPAQALPAIVLREMTEALFLERAAPPAQEKQLLPYVKPSPPPRPKPPAGYGTLRWVPRRDLLSSGRFARHFVVEVETGGQVRLRFGDGLHGWQPNPGSRFLATYRVGNGTVGNVGARVLTQIVSADPRIVSSSNNMPALSGIDPEGLEQARLNAPQAFHTQERCVTAEDYSRLAESQPEVLAARVAERWSGSWRTAHLYVQRRGGRPVDGPFRQDLARRLQPFLLAGGDLAVHGPNFVPLKIVLTVAVAQGYFQGPVRRQVAGRLSDRVLPDGTLGLFHPDRLTFGQPVFLGPVVGAAMDVPGVAGVTAQVFERLDQPGGEALLRGRIEIGALEIAMLHADPEAPRFGVLELRMEGGL
jgi:hypothetical protein